MQESIQFGIGYNDYGWTKLFQLNDQVRIGPFLGFVLYIPFVERKDEVNNPLKHDFLTVFGMIDLKVGLIVEFPWLTVNAGFRFPRQILTIKEMNFDTGCSYEFLTKGDNPHPFEVAVINLYTTTRALLATWKVGWYVDFMHFLPGQIRYKGTDYKRFFSFEIYGDLTNHTHQGGIKVNNKCSVLIPECRRCPERSRTYDTQLDVSQYVRFGIKFGFGIVSV